MTSVVLQQNEFIIKLDNDLQNLLEEKEWFNVKLTNPHKDGDKNPYFQVLKALLHEVIQKDRESRENM
jgi:hypothetical protein